MVTALRGTRGQWSQNIDFLILQYKIRQSFWYWFFQSNHLLMIEKKETQTFPARFNLHMSLVFYNFPGCVVVAEQIDEDWESQSHKVLCLNLTTQFVEDGPFGHVGATFTETAFVFFVVRIPPFGSRCFKMPVWYNDVVVFLFFITNEVKREPHGSDASKGMVNIKITLFGIHQFSFWYSSIDITKYD